MSNQAVSKWESDQCCPDITLLPKLADALGLSLNELFGIAPREPEAANTSDEPEEVEKPEEPEEPDEPEEPEEPVEPTSVSGGEKLRAALLSVTESFTGKGKEKIRVEGLPWKDDKAMRVVVFIGHRLITHMNEAPKMEFTYKATPHKDRLTALHAACLHLFRHTAQKLLDILPYVCVVSGQSDEKSDGAIRTQSLCGAAITARRWMCIRS